MKVANTLKKMTNACLSLMGIEVITKRKENAELERLHNLKKAHFEEPVFPILKMYKQCDPSEILRKVAHQKTFWREIACQNKGEFQIANDYFTSPDAEVLTAMVELFKPQTIIEIGSGNSTRLFRAASDEFQAHSRIISIDPFPRVETDKYAHQVIRKKLEEIKDETFFDQIKPGDFLFIDSSHEVKTGNDVVELLLNILPRLQAGVLIHIHDIFLPYDYPKEWIIQNRWPWTEQYLVQALLQGSEEYEVLWAGHYYQKTMSNFRQHFPYWQGKDASSLWLRKK